MLSLLTTLALPLLIQGDRVPPHPIALSPKGEVLVAARAFMRAISSDDKTALADHMVTGGVIFVHNRLDPDNPQLRVIPVADHLERWSQGTRDTEERMRYSKIDVDGDMAHVWGPYSFAVDGEVTHCGVNSLSMVKTDDGWKVANTSFSMVAPSECGQYELAWLQD